MKFIKELNEKNNKVGRGTQIVQSFFVDEKVDEKLGTFQDLKKGGVENYDFGKKIKSPVYFDYPLDLNKIYIFEVEYRTLYELIDEIRKAYQFIYKNADTTNPFGVWGHDIGDLWIEEIHIYRNGDIGLYIGS